VVRERADAEPSEVQPIARLAMLVRCLSPSTGGEASNPNDVFSPDAGSPLPTQHVETRKAAQYTLIIGINPSATTKSGAVDTAVNPGHTIVALKDPQGKLEKVFSYGPRSHFPISCSCPAGTNYHLDKKDTYTIFEFTITEDQHKKALEKIKEIEDKPGTFDANDQCTSKSLDIVRSASLSIPDGKGRVSVPFCSIPGDVSTPVDLDKALLKQFPDAGNVPATYFNGFVPIR
jgi:hypothetical protein